MRDDAGCVEHRLQTLLDMPGLVGLVADQDESMRPRIRRSRYAAVERGDRDRQLAVNVVEVLGRWIVVRHPDEAVGGEVNLIVQAGTGPALGNVVADLTAELGQGTAAGE